MYKIICILLLAIVGCGTQPTPAIPPTSDDFVKNGNGVGTARVFGIDFRMKTDSSGASAQTEISANFVEPERSTARKRFSLGDDVTIELESIDESQVRFVFNKQDFGILYVGDEVVIDDQRDVEVNGTKRLPN